MSAQMSDEIKHGIASAGYSVTVTLSIPNRLGQFAEIVSKVASLGGSIAEVDLLYSDSSHNIREITINCTTDKHSANIVECLKSFPTCRLLEWRDDTFYNHRGGKLEVVSRARIETADDLARAYTPGVARVCNAIKDNPDNAFKYTIKSNTVAVVSDGSAVLGLGNIGPAAAMPVMEGKAVLFKRFAGVDAFPICLETQDTEEIIKCVKQISTVFGGINLEDISAPRCFEIERRLKAELDIPVFHDDQHGTAVVVLAGLINALKIVGKRIEDLKIVVNGFGAGGVACTKILVAAGARHIIPCDSAGIVYRGRTESMNAVKEEVLGYTNPDNIKGSLADAMRGADMFLGVSVPGAVTVDMVRSMAKDPIVFACANPIPEILPDLIKNDAAVIATGRSDYSNQINNVLCFPGIFKGAMECRASDITEGMKVAAAKAIAECVSEDDLCASYVVPSVFKGNVGEAVAQAVKAAAIAEGVSRI
jgi:malate dehydrogenase (oxaloacetate-decarboxylating)